MPSPISQFFYIGTLLSMLALTANHLPTLSTEQTLDMQGHRGARGEYPEHTLAGFEAALTAGVQTLELDLHYTKDQRFVLFHDHQILPSNAKWDAQTLPIEGNYLYELTSDELEKVDIASIKKPKFPDQATLPAAAPLFFDEWITSSNYPNWKHVCYNIEIKIAPDSPYRKNLSGLLDNLLKILQEHNLEKRVTIQSFHLPLLTSLQKKAPTIRTAALFTTTRMNALCMKLGFDQQRKKIIKETLERNCPIISPHHVYCNKAFIEECHQSGLKVIPWTVNNESNMLKLVDQGVDGIITDFPTRMMQVLKTSSKQI